MHPPPSPGVYRIDTRRGRYCFSSTDLSRITYRRSNPHGKDSPGKYLIIFVTTVIRVYGRDIVVDSNVSFKVPYLKSQTDSVPNDSNVFSLSAFADATLLVVTVPVSGVHRSVIAVLFRVFPYTRFGEHGAMLKRVKIIISFSSSSVCGDRNTYIGIAQCAR
jgi:hypothetical protein